MIIKPKIIDYNQYKAEVTNSLLSAKIAYNVTMYTIHTMYAIHCTVYYTIT